MFEDLNSPPYAPFELNSPQFLEFMQRAGSIVVLPGQELFYSAALPWLKRSKEVWAECEALPTDDVKWFGKEVLSRYVLAFHWVYQKPNLRNRFYPFCEAWAQKQVEAELEQTFLDVIGS